MEVSGQNIVTCDEEKALKCLLDAFGSAFSLEEIASAYCKASRNADLAGEILYEMQGSSSSSASHSSNADVRVEESSESSNGYSIENSCQERKNSRPKARSVSVGTVSGIIGKDYVRSMPSGNGSYGVTKPVKLDARGLPMTGIWREKTMPNISNHNQLHQDMEEFLLKMLGYGFRLDRAMIREVLESCGYDMQKSMDKLLDQSAAALDRRATVIDDSTTDGFTDMKPKSESPSYERKSYPSGKNIVSNKSVEPHQKLKDRTELQKEILSAFYKVNEHSEEAPKKTIKNANGSSWFGHAVHEPPKDSVEEYNIDLNFSRRDNMNADAEDEEEYQNVRKAVKEYRATMNEYYKAAVNAFAEGDKIKADKLLEQGHFFLKKAREADEESSRMILEPKTAEAQEMLLDLHDCGSKAAIHRLLKCHISSLAGIPSFEYLKVIINANDQDTKKGSRRRQVVLELLEQESIKWVEGETAGTILIRLDSIDRNNLSFLKT